jgi:predicted nucleic acid-binding protein
VDYGQCHACARGLKAFPKNKIRRQAVSATADHAETNLAARLGFQPDQVVQEIGYDEDVDQELREAIEEVTGTELVDEEYDDVADAVVLWFREDDGDLTDALVDAIAYMEEGGQILLLTPKTGRDGYVEPSEIGEAATTAGLSQTKSVSAGKDWAGTRLVTPKAAAKKR